MHGGYKIELIIKLKSPVSSSSLILCKHIWKKILHVIILPNQYNNLILIISAIQNYEPNVAWNLFKAQAIYTPNNIFARSFTQYTLKFEE